MAIALSVAFTPTPLAADEYLIVEATDQVSAGKSFMPRSKYKTVFVGVGADASPANILAAWNAIYGALIAGTKVFVRCYTINDAGFASTPIYDDAIVS